MSTTVYLLTSGWPSDDEYEHGVFSSVELAKRAAPADLEWEARDEAAFPGRVTYEAFSSDYPWWIETFVIDQAYQVEQAVEALSG